MNTTTPLVNDLSIREDVERELVWNPEVNPAHIAVAADAGVITLAGRVNTYAERVAAVKTAQRVRGVTVIADELTVETVGRPPADADIAASISAAFDTSAMIPGDHVAVEVRDGNVVLTGEVQWNYQRATARRAVEKIPGVVSVDSRLTLKARPSAPDTTERIRSAMIRQATLDARHIEVSVDGTEVTLAGTVGTWHERETAGRTAWSSPHVTAVHNDLTVRPWKK